MKKKLGRPRKEKGATSFSGFERAVVAMNLYDEGRMNGQKHSAAVTRTVELIKQSYLRMPISETGVKRILAAWRPRRSHTIVRFECSALSEEELVKRYVIPPHSVTTYKICVGERPNYSRHNRRLPKE